MPSRGKSTLSGLLSFGGRPTRIGGARRGARCGRRARARRSCGVAHRASSVTHSSGVLSSRSPRKRGWRIEPSACPLGERRTRTTSVGFAQRASFVCGAPSARRLVDAIGLRASRPARGAVRVVEAGADAPRVDELRRPSATAEPAARPRRSSSPDSGIHPTTAHSCRRSKRSFSHCLDAARDVRRPLRLAMRPSSPAALAACSSCAHVARSPSRE